MALRWCAAGMLETDHQFRRVTSHLHLPKLRAALEDHFKNVSAASQNEDQQAASVLVAGHGGRRVLYLVLPGVPAAGAGIGGRHSSCGCLMSKTASPGPGVW
jgi:hypothetical protein